MIYLKRFLLLLLTVLFIFGSGCNILPKANDDTSEQIVFLPDKVTQETVNGYKDTTVSENTAAETKDSETETVKPTDKTNPTADGYVANTSTKKFHLPSCTYAKNMKEENKMISDSRDELVNSGYKACKKCNP